MSDCFLFVFLLFALLTWLKGVDNAKVVPMTEEGEERGEEVARQLKLVNESKDRELENKDKVIESIRQENARLKMKIE